MNNTLKSAADLHQQVPPDWYHRSMRNNPFQWLYHTIRMKVVATKIDPVKGKVLDIGCADGVFTKVILDKTCTKEVIGIDVLKPSINWAKSHWKKEKKMKFQVGNAHKLKFPAKQFDAVFAFEIMEHVPDPTQVLKEIKRVLKKNGYIIILVPSESPLFKIVWWFVKKFWWARIWEDTHVQSFHSNNKLTKHVKKAGFKVEEDKYFWLGMLNLVKARKI